MILVLLASVRDDRICWIPVGSGIFKAESYYIRLSLMKTLIELEMRSSIIFSNLKKKKKYKL